MNERDDLDDEGDPDPDLVADLMAARVPYDLVHRVVLEQRRLQLALSDEIREAEFADRMHNAMVGRLDALRAEIDAAKAQLDLPEAAPATSKSEYRRTRRGGRPDVADWTIVRAEVERLMNHHGDFMPGDRIWNAQARLEAAVQDFCESSFGHRPAPQTVREHIGPWLRDWRDERRRLENLPA